MKKKIMEFLGFMFLFLISITFIFQLVSAYSTFGRPSEFGNETNTTCFIGGDNGILNCTGDIITTAGKLGVGTEELVHELTVIGFVNATEYVGRATYLNGLNCDNINFSGTIGAPNICDGDDATGGGGGGSGGNSKWVDIGNYLVPNETAAVNVNITGDFKIESGSFTCSSCINPEDVNDIDKENIENDLNTFVDIGGDTMTGDLLGTNTIMTGEINSTLGFYYQGQLLESTTANITSIATSAPITGGTVTDGAITVAITQAGSASNGYLDSTDWTTFNDKSTYTAANDLIGTISEWDSECTDCVGTDDLATNACDNNALIASPTFTSPIIDVSLKPDTAGGATLGTASTEWGAIFVGDNDKINLGDGSDAQIYFDGSRLVIKVTS